jgi:hypothetical protein
MELFNHIVRIEIIVTVFVLVTILCWFLKTLWELRGRTKTQKAKLGSIIRELGGIDDFTSELKNIDHVVVFEGKDKTTISHPFEKWSITIKNIKMKGRR